jgi:hypothetical protein
MTRFRMAFVATAAALACVLVAPSFAPGASTKAKAPSVVATLTGTSANGTTFTGNLEHARTFVRNHQLVLVGTLTGTFTNAAGETLGTVTQQIETTVLSAQSGQRHLAIRAATCGILNLTLGPLDLDLLGLVVHLDTVHLVISAESGPGNLLGNLLCAVTNLLNGPAALNAVANLLNTILARL